MAESDVLKKEDVDDITDVLQVAPHQKNNQFSTVTKSETGDLVSLDELYEKTGQEAINRFIDGFSELARTDRLSRAHGMALNIQGAEQWFALPDIHNSRIGKESFFSAIKKGVVAIVKAIVAFVKGVCNWIYTRISSLLGFSRTVAEAKYVYENSERWGKLAGVVMKKLGLTPAQTEQFVASLEENLTFREMLVLTKNRVDNSAQAFERLQETQTKIAEYTRAINGWHKNLRLAKRAADANIAQLRRLLNQRQPITAVDLADISANYTLIIKEHLNPAQPTAYLAELVDSLYGIEIEGLGVQQDLNVLRDALKSQIESFNQTYAKDQVKIVDEFILMSYRVRFNQQIPEIDKDVVNTLRKMVDEKDAVVIQQVDALAMGNQALTEAYVTYCKSVSTYAESIEMILNIVQRIDKSITNILKWRANANFFLPIVLTQDLLAIQQAAQNKDQNFKELSKHAQLLIDAMEVNGYHGGDGVDMFHDMVSTGIQEVLKSPQGKELLAVYQKHKNRIISA